MYKLFERLGQKAPGCRNLQTITSLGGAAATDRAIRLMLPQNRKVFPGAQRAGEAPWVYHIISKIDIGKNGGHPDEGSSVVNAFDIETKALTLMPYPLHYPLHSLALCRTVSIRWREMQMNKWPNRSRQEFMP
jgi:hypothetical protein